jgi:hypothetical protein
MKILTAISLAMLASLAGCNREPKPANVEKTPSSAEKTKETRARCEAEYEAAKKTLERIKSSMDAVWLEKIASSWEEIEKLKPVIDRLNCDAKGMRSAAFLRLGALGTPESLAAIDRIEAKAKSSLISTCPPIIQTGKSWPHPCWHYGASELAPLVQLKGKKGKTYGIFLSPHLGNARQNLFLSSCSKSDKKIWTRLLLIPVSNPALNKKALPSESDSEEFEDPALAMVGKDQLTFSFTRQTRVYKPRPIHSPDESAWEFDHCRSEKIEIGIPITEISKDSDGDGWTDVEEESLGLNPNQADSDGDGIKDGTDITPNYAAQPGDEQSDEVAVIQQAVFYCFGLSESHYLLLVGPTSRKVQLWGYSGPVLYVQDSKEWKKKHEHGGTIFVDWEVKIDGDSATVMIKDWEGDMSASWTEVILKKKNGKWIATGLGMIIIS